MKRNSSSIAVFLLTIWSSVVVSAADDIRRDQLDRLQREELEREQQRQDEVLLPGAEKPTEMPAQVDAGPCQPVQSIVLEPLSELSESVLGVLHEIATQAERRCLSMAGIQGLQRELTNALVQRGWVTSRVLIPEQNLGSGTLRFHVLAGFVQATVAEGLSDRQVRAAMSARAGDMVNLRGLEQAVENLNRVPGMNASFQLLPGETNGASVVQVRNRPARRWQPWLSVTEKIYGSVAHGYAAAGVSVGAPLGYADRLNLSVNSDIDQELSDAAWGGTVGYDFAWGYWLLAADASYQRYRDEVQGALVAFDTDGHSGYVQADISRVLYRSRLSRFSLGLFRRQDDIRNRINDNTIRVSSYRLHSNGLRLEGSHLVGPYQLGGSFSAEHMTAAGPAAELLLEEPVADGSSWRYKLFASALRDLPALKSTLQLQLNAQHSDDRLYPVKQLSLGAFVQGYEDVALTGNSAATVATEWSLRPRQFGAWSVRPFLAPQAGWVLANNDTEQTQRMAALVAGTAMTYRRVGLNMDVAWPWDRASTVESRNEYVLRASFSVSY